jgi:hypothetical protein
MSGDNNSNPLNVDLNKLDAALDEYERSLGLGQFQQPGESAEFNTYFTMDRATIEKLSDIDCRQIAIRLLQLSYHIQRAHNRDQARGIWAQDRLTQLIAQSLGQYDKYMKTEHKIALICKENDTADKLRRMVNFATERSTRLSFLSNSIKSLADIFLANAKRMPQHE